MSDLAAYVEALESGRRKPSISGVERVLRNLGGLDRPALLHGFFERWDEFGDEIDAEWRRYRDPFLLARLNVFTNQREPLPTTARELRARSGDLGEADQLWRRFINVLPDEPLWRFQWLRHGSGTRYPNWPDHLPFSGPLLLRVPLDSEDDPLRVPESREEATAIAKRSLIRGRINMSAIGFTSHFSATSQFTTWLKELGVPRVFLGVEFLDAYIDEPQIRFETGPTYEFAGREWARPGTLTAHVNLPFEMHRQMNDEEVNDEERARRVFADAMRILYSSSPA